MSTSVAGRWEPLPHILFGVAIFPFAPVVVDPGVLDVKGKGKARDEEPEDAERQEATSELVTANPHQVPLEVGDDCYAFEQYVPYVPASNRQGADASALWYRGYVFSGVHQTAALPPIESEDEMDAFGTSSSDSPSAPPSEPQVFIGIFPASHVQVREHLEDVERRLGVASTQDQPPQGGALQRSMSRSWNRAGQMEPLPEEDETEVTTPRSSRQLTPSPSANFGLGMRRSRGSVASISTELFSSLRPAAAADSEKNLPAPPLPSLKPGDETVAGQDEPLIDEIACALREWYNLLYLHLHRRDYALFATMKTHMEVLHMGRRQLLAQTLSTDEVAKLRRDLVRRLVAGNVAQGLDVIVRHPDYGALVDTEVDPEAVDSRTWMSAIRMYVTQVNLAYMTKSKDREALLGGEGATSALMSASASQSKLAEPNYVPLNAHLPNARSAKAITSGVGGDTSSVTTRPKFFHVWLDVKGFGTPPCGLGDTAELYFSLYNKSDARFLTEEFCVILNHHGVPLREDARGGKIRTLFKDLSHHDVQDSIYLVCRIVKNGHFKSAPGVANGAAAADGVAPGLTPPKERDETETMASSASGGEGVAQRYASPDANGEYSGMTFTQSSGQQSFRRPFGCAVVEISGFSNPDTTEPLSNPPKAYTMAVFTPANEAAFPTLHEDIIGSRLKELVRSTRMETIGIAMRVFYGDAAAISREHSSLTAEAPVTSRLGFPDVVFPDDSRSEIFIKLWSGEFPSAGMGAKLGGSGKNIEVAAEVRAKTGQVLERVISRGAGEAKVTRYNSMVYRANGSPTWGELMKLDITVERVEDCHLFFTFRNRSDKTRGPAGTIEPPFAFAFLPLFADNAFIPDGGHDLTLFRYDGKSAAPEAYLRATPYLHNGQPPQITPAMVRILVPLRDSFVVRTFLCSTRHTQDDTLLRLMQWDKGLLDKPDELREVLTKLRFASEVEICKFLRNIFDALFGVLASSQNAEALYDDLIFTALVTLLSIISDRRFTNFKPVVDIYIEQHFACRTASAHLIRSLQRLLSKPAAPETAQTLRASIKVWDYLIRFIVRSRELQRVRDVGMSDSGPTSDAIEGKFKSDLTGLLKRITAMMSVTTPSSIIGTQTLAVQHYASLLPELSKCYAAEELLGMANDFCDAITATKGKIVIWKLLLQEQIVMSALFDSAECRLHLVPKLTTWIKPHLGKFEEFTMLKPKDTEATKDAARVSWLEGIRICASVIAAALDKLHEALIDPGIVSYRNSLAQEQDNVEYLLGLLPKLLESYAELENPANLAAVQRTRSTVAVITPVPAVFPSAYPFSLLSVLPAGGNPSQAPPQPTMQNSMGEIAAVIVSMLLLAPPRLLAGFLDAMLEVEGKDNFARFLSQLFCVCTSILENRAFPPQWLNISILAHRTVLKMVEVVSGLLQREFIPLQNASYAFNTRLWADFFTMLHRLLASKHLLIEDFAPQRRRAVWRLAGDIRGEGSRVLLSMWQAIGAPESKVGEPTTGTPATQFGGFQVQFVPSMVEPLLELCLSHHDEMRSNAVMVLYSMIVSEYALNQNFNVIGDDIIDKLDQLIGNSNSRGDELSRIFFVGQLRNLFDASEVDDELKRQVNAFLESVNQFLDLLLSIRALPPGDEFIDDRVIGTLKLMSFIRNIGRSAIYIRYVHKLVNFHIACTNYTEAGLALKLHADLHAWDLTTVAEAMPDLDLPQQSEFARKETLFLRILDLLNKGKAWESGLEICKELQAQYEHCSFNYERLAEVLSHQSSLYQNIVKSDRYFSEYFRVAFYGLGFPASVQNRQFVYRGAAWEKYAAFCDRMHNKHPRAQILKTATVPIEQLQYAEGQFLHITSVAAEPDRTSIIFTNPAVPNAVRTYYEHNATNTFTCSRPFAKGPPQGEDVTNTWYEKTYLVCEDAFPTVLQRSEVLEIRLLEVSPLENAIIMVDDTTRELDALKRRYLALSQTGGTTLNTNPLSMALNGAVDTPISAGIPMYRSTFLSTTYSNEHPEQGELLCQLKSAIEHQTVVLDECLRLHASLCPPEMRTFHATLQRFFEKNFAEEIARLPPRPAASSLGESLQNTQDSDSIGPLPAPFSPSNGMGRHGILGGSDPTQRESARLKAEFGRSRSASVDTSISVGTAAFSTTGTLTGTIAASLYTPLAAPNHHDLNQRGLSGGVDTAPTHGSNLLGLDNNAATLDRRASTSASTAAFAEPLMSPSMVTTTSQTSLRSAISAADSWPSAPNGSNLLEPPQAEAGLRSVSTDTLKTAKSGERRSILGVRFGTKRSR